MSLCTCVHVCGARVCVCTAIRDCACIFTCLHACVHVCLCTVVCLHVCTCVPRHLVCVHVCACRCACAENSELLLSFEYLNYIRIMNYMHHF